MVRANRTHAPRLHHPAIGDTIANPFILPAIPCTVTGTTIGSINDYDEICPYSGSTAPDVVYAYVAAARSPSISIDLCYSSYDTKVYVYDAADLVNPIACNDDFYFAAPCYTYSSYLGQVPVVAGHTYYIVLDGYGGSGGAYLMSVTDGGIASAARRLLRPQRGLHDHDPEMRAPASGRARTRSATRMRARCRRRSRARRALCIEGEPLCQDNYVDHYNGGCNSTPVVWQALAPQAGGCVTICGQGCTYSSYGDSSRDTDWYVSVSAGGPVTFTMTADFPFMMILHNWLDCALCSHELLHR